MWILVSSSLKYQEGERTSRWNHQPVNHLQRIHSRVKERGTVMFLCLMLRMHWWYQCPICIIACPTQPAPKAKMLPLPETWPSWTHPTNAQGGHGQHLEHMIVSPLTQPFLEVSCHHIRPTTVDVEATQKQSSNRFSPTWGRWLAQRWTMVNLCLWLFWMHMTLGLPACVAGPTKDRASRTSRSSIWTCGNQREMETSRQLQWTVYFCFARLGYRKGSHFLRVLVPMYIYIYRTSCWLVLNSTK